MNASPGMLSGPPTRLTRPLVELRLRRQLGLVFGAATLVLIVLLGAVAGRQAAAQVDAQTRIALAETAAHMSDALDSTMFERWREIRNLASTDEFSSTETPAERLRERLDLARRTFPAYAWIGVTDASGRVRASTDRVLEGQDVSGRPWFDAGRERATTLDVHEAKLLARVLGPSPDGEPMRFVDVAAPLRDRSGIVTGVLGAHLSWSWVREVEASVLDPHRSRPSLEIYVLDSNGEAVFAPERKRGIKPRSLDARRLAQNGAGIEPWTDGDEWLTVWHRSTGHRDYPGLGWTVVVRQPTAVAYAPGESIRLQIWAIGLVACFVFVALGWTLADRIEKHMEQVRDEPTSVE